jgi:hypothetical protein
MVEPNAPLFRDVYLVVFGDKKVSRIPESHVRNLLIFAGTGLKESGDYTCILCDRVQKVYPNLKDSTLLMV